MLHEVLKERKMLTAKETLCRRQQAYTLSSQERAGEILQILKRFTDLSNKRILDIGCGQGLITASLGQYADDIVGLDINVRYLQEASRHSQLQFLLADATCLPWRDKTFDIIICNDVLEHVPDPRQVIREIGRVTRESAVIFLQCANKYQIVEPHFLLPFLSWLPLRLANIYLRLSSRGKSYTLYHPLTLRQFDSITEGYDVADFTGERLLNKIKTMKISSPLLRHIISVLRLILSDEQLAHIFKPFSIHTRVLLKRD